MILRIFWWYNTAKTSKIAKFEVESKNDLNFRRRQWNTNLFTTYTTRTRTCELLLQAALFSPHGITVKELQKQLGKSENTICSHLKKIPPEMLSVDERGRNYLYQLIIE